MKISSNNMNIQVSFQRKFRIDVKGWSNSIGGFDSMSGAGTVASAYSTAGTNTATAPQSAIGSSIFGSILLVLKNGLRLVFNEVKDPS
ncbi:MAG: hypothetical protein A2287_09330 [Candidatus Melainabacteria bacterium RIFOXYA12_FULL_32_12]|nr:MAG: hypothetical protein A2287_09330 [Candidatus Melainabacteria bacterium RIFOXYA12_FULL_32_12]